MREPHRFNDGEYFALIHLASMFCSVPLGRMCLDLEGDRIYLVTRGAPKPLCSKTGKLCGQDLSAFVFLREYRWDIPSRRSYCEAICWTHLLRTCRGGSVCQSRVCLGPRSRSQGPGNKPRIRLPGRQEACFSLSLCPYQPFVLSLSVSFSLS